MGEGHQGLGRKLIIHLVLNHGAKPARQRMRLGGIQQTRRILKLCQPIGTAPRTRHQIALLRPINQGILATETHQAGDGEVGVLGLQRQPPGRPTPPDQPECRTTAAVPAATR